MKFSPLWPKAAAAAGALVVELTQPSTTAGHKSGRFNSRKSSKYSRHQSSTTDAAHVKLPESLERPDFDESIKLWKMFFFLCDHFRNTESDSIALLAASPNGSATSALTSKGDGKRVRSLKGRDKYGDVVIYLQCR